MLGGGSKVVTKSHSGLPLRAATDLAGNVYFAGRFNGGATFGTNTLLSSGPGDVFLAKYNSQGQALWVRQISAFDPNWSSVLALAVDLNPNAFVSVRYTNTPNFGATVVTNSDSFP